MVGGDGCENTCLFTCHSWADCEDDGNVCTTEECVPLLGGSGQICTTSDNTLTCDDGNACTTGDVCSGGTCTPGTGLPAWYHDADLDGFGDDTDYRCAATAPAGYVAHGGDCCDEIVTVFPGQTEYFATSYHCGTLPVERWDYDCSGTDDLMLPNCETCAAGTAVDCTTHSGWGAPESPCTAAPGCGVSDVYSYCRFVGGACSIAAGGGTTQECR
jgi:hypothetical protein